MCNIDTAQITEYLIGTGVALKQSNRVLDSAQLDIITIAYRDILARTNAQVGQKVSHLIVLSWHLGVGDACFPRLSTQRGGDLCMPYLQSDVIYLKGPQSLSNHIS